MFEKVGQWYAGVIGSKRTKTGGSNRAKTRARKNPRRRSKYPLFVVQTIQVPKSYRAANRTYFTSPSEARAYAEHLGAKRRGKIDETKNYYRFRQVDPKLMTKRYVSLKIDRAIIVKALPKSVARKAKVSDSTKPLTQAELKRLWALQATRKNPAELTLSADEKEWIRRRDLPHVRSRVMTGKKYWTVLLTLSGKDIGEKLTLVKRGKAVSTTYFLPKY